MTALELKMRLIRAATDISGDVNRALFWYRNEPLAPFGYQTAEMLVSGGRTEDILRYVMSLRRVESRRSTAGLDKVALLAQPRVPWARRWAYLVASANY